MVEELKNDNVKCVGVDTGSNFITHKVELLQIATEQFCYLIRKRYCDDKDKTVETLPKDLLKDLGTVLSKKLVLFFDHPNDSEHLSKFIPDFELFNVMDIQKLIIKLKFKAYADDGNVKNLPGLTDLVEEWLGKPLNKAQQLSNWAANGDLTPEQICYAAIDAWVLVKLLGKIQNDARYTEDDMKEALSKSQFLTKNLDSIDIVPVLHNM